MTQVTRRKEGRTGYVKIDNPPVNAIGLAVRKGLLAAVEWAESEDLERVIVSGAGRVFAAGGDAKEFDAPPEPPHLPDVLNRIENSAVPWIAAAHGAALGGGLELMLVCKYRIAAPETRIGLPETVIGVVPGAGGTQRLPRLTGAGPAYQMIPAGKTVTAESAHEMGLIDAAAEDPAAEAELINSELLYTRVAAGDLPNPAPDEAAMRAARAAAAKRMRGQTAPGRAADLIALASSAPLAEGMAEERKVFLELRRSAECRALRHVFFAERAAGPPPDIADVKPPPLSRAVVAGGGMMGSGIAYAMLTAGLSVTVLETDKAAAERAAAGIAGLIGAGVKRGAVSAAEAAALRSRLTVTQNYAAAAGAGLAVEAAFEDMEVKKSVFAAFQKALPHDAVLATNTSYLDVNEIAAAADDPSRVLGLHFFAPAHIMKLLEIVRGRKTSNTALAAGFALAKRLRKIPVVCGVCDGFAGNRILARAREAADTLLMDGALPCEIDAAMTEFGYAMGPYETQDLSGLDIGWANRRRQDKTRNPARRYIPIADRMVEQGRFGRKTGAGWHAYTDGVKTPDPAAEALILEEARRAGVTRRAFTADEIRRRLLHAMINEAADILHEGIAGKASDIDLITVHGYNFPRRRGGLMHYADTLGPAAVLKILKDLSKEDALVWRPSPLITACAAQNIPFADWRPA